MLRIHLFNIFTIKTPRALAAIEPLGLLIVKTLTNLLLLLGTSSHATVPELSPPVITRLTTYIRLVKKEQEIYLKDKYERKFIMLKKIQGNSN